MKPKYLILFLLVAVIMTACETPCQRRMRIGGPEYYATFVYKFPEGKDLSQNVMVMTGHSHIGEDDTIIYVHGYRPIPLHNGYYLDGPILTTKEGREPFYYLTITYDDIDNGTAPSDWKENWRDYVIPCMTRYNVYCAYEELWYRGYLSCEDYRESELYNEDITLHTPIMEDVHIDTNVLNQWIDENNLIQPRMFGGWMYGGANI